MAIRWIKGMLVGLLLTAGMGCSKEGVKEEVQKYDIRLHAYEEGNREAKTEGLGLNGRILERIQELFSDQNVRLTNETYTEDQSGTMAYHYRMNADTNQQLKLFVFKDEPTRIHGIKEMYGGHGMIEKGKTRHLVIVDKEAALVYTSAGERMGQYTEQTRKVATDVLKEIPRQSNRVNNVEESGGNPNDPYGNDMYNNNE